MPVILCLCLNPLNAPTDQAITLPETVDQLVAAWLLGYDSARTRRAYARDLADWLAFCRQYGLEPLGALRAHVDAYARELGEVRDQSPATVARRLSALASFYAYAVGEGILARSPVAHVRRPKVAADSPSTGFDREESPQSWRRRSAARRAGRASATLPCLAFLPTPGAGWAKSWAPMSPIWIRSADTECSISGARVGRGPGWRWRRWSAVHLTPTWRGARQVRCL